MRTRELPFGAPSVHVAGRGGFELLVLPTTGRPRWWVPIADARVVRNALAHYAPYSRRGRLGKRAVELLFGIPGAVFAFPRASRLALPGSNALLRLAQEVYERGDLLLSFACGTPGLYQKMTVQVMERSGQVLGFMKLALTVQAEGRIRHEADVLRELTARSELSPFLPRPRCCVEVEGRSVLLMDAVAGLAVHPDHPPPIHPFLERLHAQERGGMDGYELVDRVAFQVGMFERFRAAPWDRALAWAGERLGKARLTTSRIHGDFVPWNLRATAERLFVIDWEQSETGWPPSWDLFHFEAQGMVLLGSRAAGRRLAGLLAQPPMEITRSLYVLYLLWSGARLCEEGSGTMAHVLGAREHELGRFLAMAGSSFPTHSSSAGGQAEIA